MCICTGGKPFQPRNTSVRMSSVQCKRNRPADWLSLIPCIRRMQKFTDLLLLLHIILLQEPAGKRIPGFFVRSEDEIIFGSLFVESNRAFQFSMIPFSDVLLEKVRHINELERDGLLTVHLDAEQAGVGTATCGPGVLPQYLVPLKKQSFEFTLYPVK